MCDEKLEQHHQVQAMLEQLPVGEFVTFVDFDIKRWGHDSFSMFCELGCIGNFSFDAATAFLKVTGGKS